MLRIHRLHGLIVQLAEHGLFFGRDSPSVGSAGAEPGTVEEALPAVRAYLDRPVMPGGEVPVVTEEQLVLALVAGARRAAEDVAAIERAAAAIAREHGVTVRRLAETAGISERAAATRYRRRLMRPGL